MRCVALLAPAMPAPSPWSAVPGTPLLAVPVAVTARLALHTACLALPHRGQTLLCSALPALLALPCTPPTAVRPSDGLLNASLDSAQLPSPLLVVIAS